MVSGGHGSTGGHTMDYENATILDSNDFETLYQIETVTGDVISVIVNEDGDEFFNTDWQGIQQQTLEECADYQWVSGEEIDY
jgi:hypothetical protein